jgi:hypothetical protein
MSRRVDDQMTIEASTSRLVSKPDNIMTQAYGRAFLQRCLAPNFAAPLNWFVTNMVDINKRFSQAERWALAQVGTQNYEKGSWIHGFRTLLLWIRNRMQCNRRL